MKTVRIVWCVLALVSLSMMLHYAGAQSNRVIAGYYSDWAQYHKYCQNYPQLDSNGFTHIILGFGKITDTYEVAMFDDWGDPKVYEELRQQKAKFPGLRTILAFGGWNYCQYPPTCYIFPKLAASSNNRQLFIKNLIAFLNTNGFDGIDFDWEYPGVCGSIEDEQNYVYLVRDVKAAFEAEAASTGKERKLVTAALPVPQNHPDMKYKELSQYLDWINLMTYDFHGTWDGKTGPNSPLDGMDANDALSIRNQVNILLGKGVSKDKIVVGMAFYGHSFTLADTSNVGFNSPSWSPGAAGPCTVSAGTMAWFEIAPWKNDPAVTTKMDAQTATMISYKSNFWISYDDPTTIAIKCKYIVDNGLRGGMNWLMDHDDEAKSMGKAMVAGLKGSTPTPTTYCPTLSSTSVGNTQSFTCANKVAGDKCTYTCATGYETSSGGSSETTTCTKSSTGVMSWLPAPSACIKKPAPSAYSWKVGSFAPCAGECGMGTQTRTVVCVKSDGTSATDIDCINAGLPKPYTTQGCTVLVSKCGVNTDCVDNKCACKSGYSGDPLAGCTMIPPGTYSWKLGSFGACVGECGVGSQTRTAVCVKGDGTATTDSECINAGLAKPYTVQDCTLAVSKCGANTNCVSNKCVCQAGYAGDPLVGCTTTPTPTTEYEWLPSAWSTCTGFCGYGTQTRSLSCVTSKDKKPAYWSSCEKLPQPPTTQQCKLPNPCKCQTHCDCITWSNPSDLDPVCYNGECVDIPVLCSVIASERVAPTDPHGAARAAMQRAKSHAPSKLSGVMNAAKKVGGSEKTKNVLTYWLPLTAGVALLAGLAGYGGNYFIKRRRELEGTEETLGDVREVTEPTTAHDKVVEERLTRPKRGTHGTA